MIFLTTLIFQPVIKFSWLFKMDGWFYGMSTFVGLFQVSLNDPNYIWYKMYLHNHFKQANTLYLVVTSKFEEPLYR